MKLPRLVLEEGPVAPFSDKLKFEDAALAEPLACALNGLELAGMGLGKTIQTLTMLLYIKEREPSASGGLPGPVSYSGSNSL